MGGFPLCLLAICGWFLFICWAPAPFFCCFVVVFEAKRKSGWGICRSSGALVLCRFLVCLFCLCHLSWLYSWNHCVSIASFLSDFLCLYELQDRALEPHRPNTEKIPAAIIRKSFDGEPWSPWQGNWLDRWATLAIRKGEVISRFHVIFRRVFWLLQNHLDIQKYYNMLLVMHTQVSQVCICAWLTHYIIFIQFPSISTAGRAIDVGSGRIRGRLRRTVDGIVDTEVLSHDARWSCAMVRNGWLTWLRKKSGRLWLLFPNRSAIFNWYPKDLGLKANWRSPYPLSMSFELSSHLKISAFNHWITRPTLNSQFGWQLNKTHTHITHIYIYFYASILRWRPHTQNIHEYPILHCAWILFHLRFSVDVHGGSKSASS